MSILDIVGISLGLAMDAFAVAISAGITIPRITSRHYFRLSFHFGLFQAFMPLIGWMAGKTIVGYLENWNHWIAFLLLAAIGGKMLYESFQPAERRSKVDPTHGLRLVTLSLATSIDALAIGMSLAILGLEIVYPAIIIGLITMNLTFLGMKLGEKAGRFFGRWAEKLGSVVLIVIGIKILVEHLIG